MSLVLQKNDIFENSIQAKSKELSDLLLFDHTTHKNIIWATDEYAEYGAGYQFFDEIMPDEITRDHGSLICPRYLKNKYAQELRVKQRAEVFTPSWVCNMMNNVLDDEWFNKKNVFNTALKDRKEWKPTTRTIAFPTCNGKEWQDYVSKTVLEITCGEAPFLVSRYDAATGKAIPLKKRIGILDRKMRVVSENTTSDEEWLRWTYKAFQSSYGYEWQGDNILLARENLLATFQDYYQQRFEQAANIDLLLKIAEIISWNIFQMDGLKCVLPLSCTRVKQAQMSLFKDHTEECPGCKNNDIYKHTGQYVKIMDWEAKKPIKFVSLYRDRKEQA